MDDERQEGRTGDEALEERLVGQVLVVLLKVLLGGLDKLHGGELVAGATVRFPFGNRYRGRTRASRISR